MSSVHQESIAAVRTPQTHRKSPPFTQHPITHQYAKVAMAKYTQGVEQDDQHSTSHVTVLTNWATLRKCAMADTLYQNPANLYPHPPVNIISVNEAAPLITKDSIITEFPTVFDGLIRAMEDEKFHIHLSSDAKPFCVTSPRSIPFTCHDKLAAELKLLEQQHIFAPVTKPTDWCAPIVVIPKKNSDSIRMCVDLYITPKLVCENSISLLVQQKQ